MQRDVGRSSEMQRDVTRCSNPLRDAATAGCGEIVRHAATYSDIQYDVALCSDIQLGARCSDIQLDAGRGTGGEIDQCGSLTAIGCGSEYTCIQYVSFMIGPHRDQGWCRARIGITPRAR